MNRRRARAWMVWLLPAFFLRSLIPIGFMPTFSPGHGMKLVLCEGYAPVPAQMASESMQMPGDMAMDMGAAPHGTAHQEHCPCLFGSGPALGAPLVFSAAVATGPPAALLLTPSAQVSHYQAPTRAQSARAPPV